MHFVRRWSKKTEISAGRFIGWLDVAASKFYDWRELHQPAIMPAGLNGDGGMFRELREKLAIQPAIVLHTNGLARLPFLVDRHEHRIFLVCVTSDKLFHIAAAPIDLRDEVALRSTTIDERMKSSPRSAGEILRWHNGRTGAF